MVLEKGTFAGNPQEQFVKELETAKGPECLEIIKQVLDSPGVYVFAEFLEMPNVAELKSSHSTYINTLHLFAYGTYKEYLSNKNNFLELSANQKKKLQHLTMATLATQSKCIPYARLLEELNVNNVRDLEDLIIEAIYADIVNGKLDQKNSLLEVDNAIGRDIKPGDIDVVVNCLQDWCAACEGVLSCVETQIMRANSEKNRSITRKVDIETEINNIKKTLKTQMQERAEGADESMATDSREATASGEKGKKPSKVKGLKILR